MMPKARIPTEAKAKTTRTRRLLRRFLMKVGVMVSTRGASADGEIWPLGWFPSIPLAFSFSAFALANTDPPKSASDFLLRIPLIKRAVEVGQLLWETEAIRLPTGTLFGLSDPFSTNPIKVLRISNPVARRITSHEPKATGCLDLRPSSFASPNHFGFALNDY